MLQVKRHSLIVEYAVEKDVPELMNSHRYLAYLQKLFVEI